jgi:hypothetical protein
LAEHCTTKSILFRAVVGSFESSYSNLSYDSISKKFIERFDRNYSAKLR